MHVHFYVVFRDVYEGPTHAKRTDGAGPKNQTKAVLNQPGIDNRPFISKLSRAMMKAMKVDEKYLPDDLIRWYQEDDTRGGIGRIDYRLGRVLTYAARLIVTANLY